jgi:DNA-binding IclR family transcriptional regulator
VQPVVRALRTLGVLGRERQGLTLKQLAEELSVPIGSLHRLLAVLSEERYIVRSPSSRRYFLGPAARSLAESKDTPNSILNTPHRALSDIAALSGETVFLTELIGDSAVCVALVEGSHPLRLFVQIGYELPMHAAASARVLLADLDDEDVRRLLSVTTLTAFTDETPTTVEDVMSHIALVRTRGYDVCDDELDRQVWAVSAPVLMSTGRACASITLAAPESRLADISSRRRALDAVLDAAAAMSRDLGYQGDRLSSVTGDMMKDGRESVSLRRSPAMTRITRSRTLGTGWGAE